MTRSSEFIRWPDLTQRMNSLLRAKYTNHLGDLYILRLSLSGNITTACRGGTIPCTPRKRLLSESEG